ncbi:MAG: cadherin domain-containing protein [Planctomycetaceae bacterium]|nr:cadherin domain-containing protein [Planctomycetaceae bacterium]
MLLNGFSAYFAKLFTTRYCARMAKIQQRRRENRTFRRRRYSNGSPRLEALEAKILLAAPVITTNGGNNFTVNINEFAYLNPSTAADGVYNGNQVFQIQATDADGDARVYEITGGNNNQDGDGNLPFSINSNTGQVFINDINSGTGSTLFGTNAMLGGDFNREQITSYSLTVRARTPAANNENDTIVVTVNIRDRNDAPHIPVNFYDSKSPSETARSRSNVFYINENPQQGATVGDLYVTDQDNDPIQNYRITNTPQIDNGIGMVDVFVINQNTGRITINPNIHPNAQEAQRLLREYFDYENPGANYGHFTDLALQDSLFGVYGPNSQFPQIVWGQLQNDFYVPIDVQVTDIRDVNDLIGTQDITTLNSLVTRVWVGMNDVSEFSPVVPDEEFFLQENTPNNNIAGALVGTIRPDFGIANPDPYDDDGITPLNTIVRDRGKYNSVTGAYDVGTYTFSLDPATNPGNAFVIVPIVDPITGNVNSAEIRVNTASNVDFEQIRTFNLAVTVTDTSTGNLATTATYTVNIVDINEPTTLNDATLTLQENSEAGAFVGTIAAQDVDVLTAVLDYQIIDGNNASILITAQNQLLFSNLISEPLIIGDTVIFQGIFTLDPVTGDLTVSNTISDDYLINNSPFNEDLSGVDPKIFLDFETTPTFDLIVRATDRNHAETSDVATIRVQLENVAESEPQIFDQTFTIQENRPNGTVVGTVAATPGDDIDSSINYSILDGNQAGVFAINATTGVLTVLNNANLNFETNPSFELTIQVRDPAFPDLFATATITVNLTDVNERPTISVGQVLDVFEHSVNGTSVGTVNVVEVDAGQTLTFSIISGNIGGTFAINAATGEITVANNALLDTETRPQFNLIIRVDDSGTPKLSHSQTVTIDVQNINELPVVDAVGPFSIAENSPLGSVVGTATVTDNDPGDTHTWAIIAGNTNNTFQINPLTGEISVFRPQFLNFEVTPVYTLTLRVTDAGGLQATGDVQINLTDVNELPTAVVLQNAVTEVQDIIRLTTSRKVADIVVTDDALGTNDLSVSGADASLFEIVGTELFIKAGSVLNATTNPVLDVTVNVNDPTLGGSPDLTVSHSITVLPSPLDVEPNNTPAEAIDLGVASLETMRFGQLHRNTDRIDFYRFTIPDGSAGDLVAKLSELTANAVLRIYQLNGNALGTMVGNSAKPGIQDEMLTLNDLAAGDYIIEVAMNKTEGANTTTFYQLEVDIVARIVPIDREPDNLVPEATDLGIASQGNPIDTTLASFLHRNADRVDLFRFTVAADHTATAQIDLTDLTAETALRLYRINGNTLGEQIGSSMNAGLADELINISGLAAGDYAIEVVMHKTVAGGTQSTYQIAVNVVANNFNDPEPNNTVDEPVLLGTASQFNPIMTTRYGTVNVDTDPIDIYHFSIAEGQTGDMLVNLSGLSQNVDLQIARLVNGVPSQIIGSSLNLGTLNEQIAQNGLASGDYVIGVFMNGSVPAGNQTTYILDVQVVALPIQDPESNDTPALAIDLGAAPIDVVRFGTLSRDNDRIDYYKFTINPGLEASATIDLSQLTAEVALRVYNLNGGVMGTMLGESKNPGLQDENISLALLPEGDYLIEVIMHKTVLAGVTTPYRLAVNVTITTPFEPNNSFADAYFLGEASPLFPIIQTINGNIGNIGDRYDYFKFQVADTNRGSIQINLSGLSRNVDVRVYNSSFNLIANSSNFGTNNESITLSGLLPGEYFIELIYDQFSSLGVPTDYNLGIDFTAIVDNDV